LQTQYFVTGVISLRQAPLRASSAASQARASHKRGYRLNIQRQVRQHVTHDRLIRKPLLEDGPIAGVVDGLR
jgi:hypothetical protein